MYSSDYGYVAGSTCVNGTYLRAYDNGCNNSDWLLNSMSHFSMSPKSSSTKTVFLFDISGSGNLQTNGIIFARPVRPVFSLKPEVTITEGDGTIDNPYRVE